MAKKKGRPATGHDQTRVIGRVNDETWSKLKRAAEHAGKTFTDWAVSALEKAADRELRKDKSTRSGGL